MNRIVLQKTVSDLIVVRSPRLNFHPVIPTTRQSISPGQCNNIEFVSVDEKLYRSIIVCMHCHMLFNNERWNRNVMIRHLHKFHGIDLNAEDDDYEGKMGDDGMKTKLEPINREAPIKNIDNGKRAQRQSEKVPQPEPALHHSPLLSDAIMPKVSSKIGHRHYGQKQSIEDGVQEVNIDNAVSESIPLQDTGLQVSTPTNAVAIAQAQESADSECTQVPITSADLKPKVGDQNGFCLASTTKAKSTRKRKANKDSCVAGEKGKASEKEGTGADAGEDNSKASN